MQISEPEISASDRKYHDAGQIKLIRISNFKLKNEKVKIFINNGIHPGEPDGIDASMMLARDLLIKPELRKLLDQVEVNIIPVYNTGGSLKRGCCSRANQDGPVEYGFRGNSLNLDLNRDFIKCDALETEVFENYFHKVQPHFFIDTHVSDGADYQYTMTLIVSQYQKMQNEAMENFQQNIIVPSLFKGMKNANEEICPYVNFDAELPDSGIVSFFDSPRFSSGYTSLFNCFSFIAETHMLKPFDKRVKSTYTLLLELIKLAATKNKDILNTIKKAVQIRNESYKTALQWQQDTIQFEWIEFKGFEAYYSTSPVTDLPQLYYNVSKPYTKNIKYFNRYLIKKSINYPNAYVMPYEWYKKLNLERYHLNIKIVKDTSITITAYSNLQYTNRKRPYEGNIQAGIDSMQRTNLRQEMEGNYVIIKLNDNLRYRRFLVEALEPESPDGFFAWGKMFSALQQKEGFSDYVWDGRAAQILNADPQLQKEFKELKIKDQKFAEDKDAQLEYIYRHSKYFEPSYLRYPIFRIEN